MTTHFLSKITDHRYKVVTDTGVSQHNLCEIANKIRALYKEGKHSQTSLGAMFGIKKTQVGYIIHNKRWSI